MPLKVRVHYDSAALALHHAQRSPRGGIGVWYAEPTTNLCANPSFEVDTTGWGLNGAGVQSQTRITTDSVFGVACNEVVVDGAVAGQGLFWSGTKPTTTPGAAYTLSTYVKSVSGATTLLLVIDWYQADGTTYISTSSTTATITTAWARYSFTATAPALGARAVIGPRNNNAAASTMRIDGVQFEQKSYATPYCDGSLGTGYAWTGAAHASTSTRTEGMAVL